MRIARFKTKDNQVHYGVVKGQSLSIIEGDLFTSWKDTGPSVNLGDVTLLAPVEAKSLLAIGRNYRAHAEEGGDDIPTKPLLFIKAVTCLHHPDAPVVLPKIAPAAVDYEAELAVVIGKPAKKVSEKDALKYVLGYTCGNDVSARDCQSTDGQWARGKSFDTFGPLGPWLETDLDPTNLAIKLRLNGNVMQDANTNLLIFPVAYLIHYLSQGMTLIPGTVIFTGTPAGIGFARNPKVCLKAGDVMEVDIQGIGVLKNKVVNDQ
jgi:2-keto-4-pentenoate hydratase/2-oxohepta-3-ene-1,7-dioic acid hydratase in catechol pathway